MWKLKPFAPQNSDFEAHFRQWMLSPEERCAHWCQHEFPTAKIIPDLPDFGDYQANDKGSNQHNVHSFYHNTNS